MKKFFVRSAMILFLATAALAAPPKVKSMKPANGDRMVDPAARELRIEFDQEMDRGGFSLCGGGSEFPKITARGRWESATTVVFGIQLEPGHEYRFSINCQSGRNFKNTAGEPAVATPVNFKTSGDAPVAASQAELNKKAMATLREAIDQRYSYRDRVVKDWSVLFPQIEQAAANASTATAFARDAGSILKAAQDPHLFFKIGQTITPTFQVNLQANADLKLLERLVPDWKQENAIVASGRFPEHFGYIAILSWQGEKSLFAAAHRALDGMLDAKGIIIDARFNAGGDETIAQEFAALDASSRAHH